MKRWTPAYTRDAILAVRRREWSITGPAFRWAPFSNLAALARLWTERKGGKVEFLHLAGYKHYALILTRYKPEEAGDGDAS